MSDGEYGAIEIKLGSNKIEEAVESLNRFYNLAEVKPKFMCIICGLYDAVVKRPDGIYIFPITALKTINNIIKDRLVLSFFFGL